jgi:hypothetical protein
MQRPPCVQTRTISAKPIIIFLSSGKPIKKTSFLQFFPGATLPFRSSDSSSLRPFTPIQLSSNLRRGLDELLLLACSGLNSISCSTISTVISGELQANEAVAPRKALLAHHADIPRELRPTAR